MKILSLRLKNLNALYGEWFIDFTDPAFQSNGIFALTGPTGAGKSTILDAICLALYGETPRLGRITQSTNDIMSRQTAACFAELTFESQAGVFLCHWEQRRARLKADGKLQAPEHAISEAHSGKLIETKKTLVLQVIEEKTGMDFDRFTRSILLAQGGFDTFLKANAEQKSKILEQITGTAIYSDISIRVHERLKDEQAQLTVLSAEANAIGLLTNEETASINTSIQQSKLQETQLESEWTQTKKAIDWLEKISTLQAEVANLANESHLLNAELEAFTPKRNELNLAKKAATIAREAAELETRENQFNRLQDNLTASQIQLPALTASALAHQQAVEHAEKQTVESKAALQGIAPLIIKVRALDQTIKQTNTNILDQENSINETEHKRNIQIELNKQNLAQQNEALKILAELQVYLDTHRSDAWLVSGLTGIEVELQQMTHQQGSLETLKKEKVEIEAITTTQSQAFMSAKTVFSNNQQALTLAQTELDDRRAELATLLNGKLLREYRAQKEALLREQALLEKMMALEAHRDALTDGQPCPLCGAVEHPFATNNIPAITETQTAIHHLSARIEQAENLEAIIQELDSKLHDAKAQLTASEQSCAAIKQQQTSTQASLHKLDSLLLQASASLQTMVMRLAEKLTPLGMASDTLKTNNNLLTQLKARLSTWQAKTLAYSATEKQIAQWSADKQSIEALINTFTQTITEQQQRCDIAKSSLAQMQKERIALFQNKDPDQEIQSLQTNVDKAEKKLTAAQSSYQQSKEALMAMQSKIEQLQQAIATESPELAQLQNNFDAALSDIGFANRTDYLNACLDQSTLASLSAQAQMLDEQHISLTTKQKDRQARLEEAIKLAVTDASLDTLKPHYIELDDKLKTLRNEIAALTQKLNDNETAIERAKQKQSLIEAHELDCEQWAKLHALIGSADGKKYRNFAQGLTFELMVSHANKQLANMTDRYLLIRDDDAPLALNVIDQYQAGEIRSTKNLSGGESFIVSLSLALGLSKMASRKVRVDSLFLDEGFGTLDEDALETALESLASLQHDGKLIGVISHVPALKERIHTQIAIHPISGGKSALSGPGCKKIQSIR